MKAIKYFVLGAMISISAPTFAQDVDYGTALGPVTQALKSNSAESAVLVKNYLKEYKKNPEAVIALGNSYLAVKNVDKAGEMADLALSKAKKDLKIQAQAYILKGDIEALKDESGNGGGAASHYATAMSLDPKNPQAYTRYASIYRKINPKLVEETYAKLKQEIPDYPIDAEAGHSFFSANKFDKAYENFAKCKTSDLDEGKLVEYVISAIQLRKYSEGLKIANAGSVKFPKNLTFKQLGLWSAVETSQFDEAVKIAEQFMQMEGQKNSTDYTYYGKALLGVQRYNDALVQFNKALEVDANAVEALGKIAEAYTGLGDTDKALEYSELYMKKNPNATPSDYGKLANIYVEKGNFDKALAIYDQMAEKYPSINTWAYTVAASVANKAGKADVSASYNQKIVDVLGNKTGLDADETGYLKTALSLLGYYYWGEKENLEAAKPYYEMLIKLDPEDKNAKAALGIE